MNNLRTKIQSQFDDNYSTNLDSFSDNDLRDIDSYLNELNSTGHVHNISKLSKDEQKIEIETKSGTTYIRK
jgi:hypothetical protein